MQKSGQERILKLTLLMLFLMLVGALLLTQT